MNRDRSGARREPRLRPSAATTTVAFGDEVVVYCDRTEQMHCLDQAASLVWALCDGSRTVEAIVQQAASIAGVDAGAIRTDVERALERFQSLGILR